MKAMDFAKTTIINGLTEGHTDKYCKLEPSNKAKESYFEFEIELDGKYYAYGYEVVLNESRFVSEWLFELKPDNKEKLIFTRDITNGSFELGKMLGSNGLIDKMNVYAEDVKDDSTVLFLSIMNQNKKNLYDEYKSASVLKKVYRWIKHGLDINYPDKPISDYSYMANTKNVEEICRIISAFGTGITDFKMVDVPVEKVMSQLPQGLRNDVIADLEKRTIELKKDQRIQGVGLIMRSEKDFFVLQVDRDEYVTCKTIQFSHGEKNVLFNLAEESDGTIRMLDLLEILLTEENKTYVVDELDRCLHPSLTYKFVETFLKKAADSNIQLIVTTHESRLMDFDLLRRDEIWFVNKKKTGESDIYSLEEYNERFDKKIDKAYLEGRYGGVPIFSTVFPIKEG